jgi:hypothetical protein
VADGSVIAALAGAATAVAGGLASVISAAKGPADIATLRAEIVKAKEEIGPAVKVAVDAVKTALDADMRRTLDAIGVLAGRVGALEERVAAYRREQREGAIPRVPTGSFATPDAAADILRRVAMLESRADRCEERHDRGEEREREANGALSALGISLAGISRDVVHLLEQRQGRR